MMAKKHTYILYTYIYYVYHIVQIMSDHKLRWDKWTEAVNKKGQLRIYFFRKTVSFNVSDLRLFDNYSI